MYRVLEVSLDTDLRQFSRLLWQRKLSHQIQELEGKQVLVMGAPRDIEQALALYKQWQRGEVAPAAEDDARLADFIKPVAFGAGLLRGFMRAPLTFLLIFVCCLLFIFAPLAMPTPLTLELQYPNFGLGTRTLNIPRILDTFGFEELYRMLTPILLHGGILHLVFNMLWLWDLGPRIERAQSTLTFATLVIVIGVISNTTQYVFGGPPGFPTVRFGGMSGVVFGLFAYIWMWQLIDPRKGLSLPTSLIWFMIISLVAMTALNLSMIADEAHMGGFFAGIVYGGVTALSSRLLRTTTGPKGEA
jgi:GlpG protein